MSIRRLRKSKTRHVPRRRRSAEEARSEALASARKILIAHGPDAVTLKAVAANLGTTHTNLLHHFGTAGELQSELMSAMVRDLAVALMGAVAHLRSDAGAPRALVGNLKYLEPVRAAVTELVSAIEEKFVHEKGDPHLGVTSSVLFIAFMAFGDSVIGEPLKDMLERERAAPRKVAAFLLPKFFF